MRGIHHGDMREATIDLDAITANVRHLRALTGVPVIAVVKADGYGHGAPRVAAGCRRRRRSPRSAPRRGGCAVAGVAPRARRLVR